MTGPGWVAKVDFAPPPNPLKLETYGIYIRLREVSPSLRLATRDDVILHCNYVIIQATAVLDFLFYFYF